jgi:hypothetical protein
VRTGNVIRSPGGDLWIVTEITDKLVQAVSFDHENVSAVQKLDDSTLTKWCFNCEGQLDDCETCNGAGQVTSPVRGWKHSKVLANSVRDFIEGNLRKAMGL